MWSVDELPVSETMVSIEGVATFPDGGSMMGLENFEVFLSNTENRLLPYPIRKPTTLKSWGKALMASLNLSVKALKTFSSSLVKEELVPFKLKALLKAEVDSKPKFWSKFFACLVLILLLKSLIL